MVYVFLADGFETIEALAPVDMLRRAGVDVTTVGVTGKTVTTSHNIPIVCDAVCADIDVKAAEAIVLPGGMPGTLNLEASDFVQSAIDFCAENDKFICAICAAPSILGHKGLLEGREAIAFPGFEKDLLGAQISKDYVVRDGKIITARGAGVAVDFGLEIVKALCGEEASRKIRSSIQCR